jgi:hypothetical protein
MRNTGRLLNIASKLRRRLLRVFKPVPAQPPIELPSNNQNTHYPNWQKLLGNDWTRWQQAVDVSKNGPHILIATSVGGNHPGVMLESALAVALTLRGAQVHMLLCDEFLPACMQAIVSQITPEEIKNGDFRQKVCSTCYLPAQSVYESLGIPVHRYSNFVTESEIIQAAELSAGIPVEHMRGYEYEGMAVGEHALAGALRYFARGNLDTEPGSELILRRYFEAALLTVFMAKRLLSAYPFINMTLNHGIYVPQGLLSVVARKQGLRISTWNPAYRKQCFIFSHGDTYHHTMLDEPTQTWEELTWTPAMEAEILEYLKSRWQGTQDWIWFHEKPQEDLAQIAQELGLDFKKPFIGLLTNVMWDAQLHYPANAFPDMREWLFQTIRYFVDRPELQLVIRIHPAEIRGTLKSRQPLLEEIQREFPVLPVNIFTIRPESQISTYAVMALCNAAIIYGTKTGVELSSMGIPVIVAGEAWLRNKGITQDARSPEEYRALLDQLPLASRMDTAAIQRARKYAYHFFFRRMIPLKMMRPVAGWPPYQADFNNISELLPGKDPGLDVICNAILTGSEFTYPAEILGVTTESRLVSEN